MLQKEYPLHDINIIFDNIEKQIRDGGVHEKTEEEFLLINKLFASLPPEAVEYGMQFLHGKKDLPESCKDIMPLYIRFVLLLEYLEKLDTLKDVPAQLTAEDIKERSDILNSLDEYEKRFGAPLLGYKLDDTKTATIENAQTEEQPDHLHLMNNIAPVIECEDPLQTALFYENNLNFKATHLDDETMPHIRLVRDNAVLILTDKKIYDFYIYVSEPMLLLNELKQAGVKILTDLPDAQAAGPTNREFVFEDDAGRKICVSQNFEL